MWGPRVRVKPKKRKRKKVVRANGPKASWRPIKARLTRVGGSACGLQAGLGSAQEGGPAQGTAHRPARAAACRPAREAARGQRPAPVRRLERKKGRLGFGLPGPKVARLLFSFPLLLSPSSFLFLLCFFLPAADGSAGLQRRRIGFGSSARRVRDGETVPRPMVGSRLRIGARSGSRGGVRPEGWREQGGTVVRWHV